MEGSEKEGTADREKKSSMSPTLVVSREAQAMPSARSDLADTDAALPSGILPL